MNESLNSLSFTCEIFSTAMSGVYYLFLAFVNQVLWSTYKLRSRWYSMYIMGIIGFGNHERRFTLRRRDFRKRRWPSVLYYSYRSHCYCWSCLSSREFMTRIFRLVMMFLVITGTIDTLVYSITYERQLFVAGPAYCASRKVNNSSCVVCRVRNKIGIFTEIMESVYWRGYFRNIHLIRENVSKAAIIKYIRNYDHQ